MVWRGEYASRAAWFPALSEPGPPWVVTTCQSSPGRSNFLMVETVLCEGCLVSTVGSATS